jgi:hypothetical protein
MAANKEKERALLVFWVYISIAITFGILPYFIHGKIVDLLVFIAGTTSIKMILTHYIFVTLKKEEFRFLLF